jgi:hypothetical protein
LLTGAKKMGAILYRPFENWTGFQKVVRFISPASLDYFKQKIVFIKNILVQYSDDRFQLSSYGIVMASFSHFGLALNRPFEYQNRPALGHSL